MITDDGWFRTGDMGHVDEDGYVFVSDRLKDMIITGGENVYSPEVERVLSEHPGVLEVAVIGVPDPTWGESVKAVVALKEARTPPRSSSSSGPASGWRTSRRPSPSTSSPRSPATPPARSSSASCAGRTGRSRSARSEPGPRGSPGAL